MKNIHIKRIAAIAIAVCLVISSASLAFAAPSGITIYYGLGGTSVPTETYETTHDFWQFHAASGPSYLAAGVELTGTAQRLFTRRIKVPVSGTYTPKLAGYYERKTAAGKLVVYLAKVVPGTISSLLTEANKIGEINCLNVDKTADNRTYIDTPVSFGEKELEAGEYYVIYCKLADGTDGGGQYAGAGGFLLDGGDGAVLMGGAITLTDTALTAGESTTVTASGYRSDTATAAEITYASSDESVATVNASTGAVTAVGAGTASIIATADGIITPLTKTLTVSDAAATPTADVLVTAADASRGGSAVSANITASGTDSLVKGTKSAQNVGTEITVTADAEADGATFKYWQNHMTKKVVSSERSFKFTVGSNVMLVAVYSKAPEAGKYAVYFLNKNGSVIQSTYVDNGATIGSITKPTSPTMTGYTFTGWNAEDAEVVDGDTYVMAEYVPAGIIASINVNGTSNSYAFNAEVKATSADANFSYWTRNGKIISYDNEYTFYAWGDATVTAVNDGAVTKTPRVLLDNTPIGDAFMMEYEVPTGFTKVETGIIYGGNDVTLANYTSKAISGSDAAHGQFTAMANTESFARAYLIYNNGTENKIVYSDIVAK